MAQSRMQHLTKTLRKEVLKYKVKRGADFFHNKNCADYISIINDDNAIKHVLEFHLFLTKRQNFEETQQNHQ